MAALSNTCVLEQNQYIRTEPVHKVWKHRWCTFITQMHLMTLSATVSLSFSTFPARLHHFITDFWQTDSDSVIFFCSSLISATDSSFKCLVYSETHTDKTGTDGQNCVIFSGKSLNTFIYVKVCQLKSEYLSKCIYFPTLIADKLRTQTSWDVPVISQRAGKYLLLSIDLADGRLFLWLPCVYHLLYDVFSYGAPMCPIDFYILYK